MTLIYEEFENSIAEKYIDSTELLTYLSENIEKTTLVKDAIIYIDEFMGFTKQEYDIIAKLIKLAKQVNICLCIDTLQPSANPITDIIYSNKVTLSRLLSLIEENNLQLEEPILLENPFRFKNEELKHLEKNIYNNIPTIYEKNVENIELFLAKNLYSEIENVAVKITNLVKHQNLRYKEISVIAKDMSSYSNLIRAIFSKYEIPVFIDEKRDLNQNIIIKYILSILEVLSKNFSYDSVMSYVKTGFLELENDEIFKLENYCTKWGIKYNKWDSKDWSIGEEDKDELNRLRRLIVEPLLAFKRDLEDKKTVKQITKALYQFLIQDFLI